MLVFKLGILNVLIYFFAVLILSVFLFAAARFKGMLWLPMNWRVIGPIFALIWLISFTAAWRLLFSWTSHR